MNWNSQALEKNEKKKKKTISKNTKKFTMHNLPEQEDLTDHRHGKKRNALRWLLKVFLESISLIVIGHLFYKSGAM